MIFEDLGLLFFTALILSLLLTPASITFAHYIGAVDDPVGRSVHTQAMTRLGGLGMTAATIVALLLFYPMTDYMTALLLGVTCMVAVGVIDDLVQISPSKKMAGQILACVIFLGLSGLSIHSFGDLFGAGEIVLGEELAFLVTLFCMLGIINAFNLSDGLDGLAAGLTVVASIFMIVLAIYTQHWFVLATLLALLGGLLGFLKYNTHPAKLFMGDTGSLALGFFMACTVVYLVNVESTMLLQPMTLALILAVPLSDTLIVMTRRILQGKSPVSPDKTHLHHRLLDLGFSHAVVVILMYILSFACGALAMLVYQEPAWLQLLVGLVFCLCVYVALTWMEHQQCDASLWSLLSQQEKELETKLAVMVTKSLRWLRLTILVGLLLPITFVHSVPESVSGLLLAIFVLLLFAFPWREHRERLNIVYGLFYLSGLSILYVWNISTYQDIEMSWYTLCFVLVLTIWSALKIRFKGIHEVFLTSGLEVLLIVTSWFVPYVLLPALQVPDEILQAVKTSCLEAIPLFIAMKIVIRRDPSRNKGMVVGLLSILLLMMVTL